MSKYILELKDDVQMVQKVGVAKNGNAFVMNFYKDQLEELTADYINEHFGCLQQDAYDKGYKDGRNVTETQAHDDAYQRGLNDAWEVAKKIADMWTRIGNTELLAIFGITERIGNSTIRSLFEKQTANEAMLELEAYEEKQKTDNCIEIGDEVEWDGDKYIVTYRNIDPNIGVIQDYDLLAYDGSVVDHVKKCAFTKTGRHFDISSILKEIQS